MTADEITALTAFIGHPALRAQAAARLASGSLTICPDCGQFADAGNGCLPCNDAFWEDQARQHDIQQEAQEADADWFSARASALAGQSQGFDVKDYEFRNFCEAVN